MWISRDGVGTSGNTYMIHCSLRLSTLSLAEGHDIFYYVPQIVQQLLLFN